MSCRVCTNKSSRVLIGVEKRPMVKILRFWPASQAGAMCRNGTNAAGMPTLAGGAVPLETNATTEPRFRTIGRAGPRERHFSGWRVSPGETREKRHG
jgi:hypothetical protein